MAWGVGLTQGDTYFSPPGRKLNLYDALTRYKVLSFVTFFNNQNCLRYILFNHVLGEK